MSTEQAATGGRRGPGVCQWSSCPSPQGVRHQPQGARHQPHTGHAASCHFTLLSGTATLLQGLSSQKDGCQGTSAGLQRRRGLGPTHLGSLLRSHSLSHNPQPPVLAARGRCCSTLHSASVLPIPSGVGTSPAAHTQRSQEQSLPPPAPAWGAPVLLCSCLWEPSATCEERTPCREAWRHGYLAAQRLLTKAVLPLATALVVKSSLGAHLRPTN